RRRRRGARQGAAPARIRSRRRRTESRGPGLARARRPRPLLRRRRGLRGSLRHRAGRLRGTARADPRRRGAVTLPPGARDARRLAGAPVFGAEGACAVAGFGSLRLSNEPAEDWPSFYAERRLLPLAGMARERGSLSAAGSAAVERVCERLPDLSGPAEAPARL